MKTYELLTVFKPNLDAEEVDKALERLNAFVSEMGGKVESTDKTGRKKLAYEIQNFRDGFFVTTLLTLPAEKVADFKRQLRLSDSILRTMFLESKCVFIYLLFSSSKFLILVKEKKLLLEFFQNVMP